MSFTKLRLLITSSTSKDLIINLGGMSVGAFLGFLFFLFVSRELGPIQFGVFSALLAIIVILSDITDLGVSAGLAKFVAKYENMGKQNIVGRFLVLSLITKLSLVSVIVLIGLIITDPLSKILFQGDVSKENFTWSLIGSVAMSFFSFASFALLARRKFLLNSIFIIIGNLSRIILVILCGSILVLNITVALQLYILGLLVPAILGLLFLPATLLRFIPTKPEIKELFAFNKWLAAGILMFTIFTKIDNLLVVSLNSAFEGGIYGVAQRITFIFPLLVSSLAGVWSPRFASFNSRKDAMTYFWKTLIVVGALSVGTLLLMPLSHFIVQTFFGYQYGAAIIPLNILLIAWVLFLLLVPAIQYITYYMERSDLYALITFFQFAVIIILDILLIPNYGAKGAAIAFLIGNFIALLSAYFFVFYRTRNHE